MPIRYSLENKAAALYTFCIDSHCAPLAEEELIRAIDKRNVSGECMYNVHPLSESRDDNLDREIEQFARDHVFGHVFWADVVSIEYRLEGCMPFAPATYVHEIGVIQERSSRYDGVLWFELSFYESDDFDEEIDQEAIRLNHARRLTEGEKSSWRAHRINCGRRCDRGRKPRHRNTARDSIRVAA